MCPPILIIRRVHVTKVCAAAVLLNNDTLILYYLKVYPFSLFHVEKIVCLSIESLVK